MLSLLLYLYAIVICTLFLIVSALVLVVTWPFDKSRRAVHELSRVLVHLFFGVPPLWRFRVEGLEHVDRSRSYVIVLNHQAMTDIPALYCVPLNFRWVSKREVFRIPFFGQFLRLHGDICIDRGHASVAIFPEGTRSKDGEIHRFKAGAFELARKAGVEILPVVLDGTTTLVKRNRLFNWRNTIRVKVLAPVPAGQVAATDTKELMAGVRERMVGALEAIRNENKVG